jgi:ATP-dependent DNA helicase DinG
MPTLVALDLETTGLDPETDAIIEIGAVKFKGSRIEREYQTLVNPGRPLTPFVTQLTGINDEMLGGAPRLQDVLDDLRAFIGDLPVLGHNIAFDLGFLRRRGLLTLNRELDTYDLASVLRPSAGRYGLLSLANDLGVINHQPHRAVHDARTTMAVFLRLFEAACQLPTDLLAEIVRLGSEIEWGAGWIFESAWKQSSGGRRLPEAPVSFDSPGLAPANRAAEGLSPVEEPACLPVDEMASILEPGGEFARQFPGYEYRSQQISMLRAVTEAFNDGRHLLVEAGTGTGKSMAYLIPAFVWANRNGRRVVISTNTLNLQDQLIHKDIPDLRAAMGTDFRAAVLKGRANYLCPRRLLALRQLRPRSADEMRVLAKVMCWLSQGGSGDRNEINLRGLGETQVWSRLSADNDGCSLEMCSTEMDGICPYYKAHRSAEQAHVVIVNHALLLADIATGNRVIPEYNHLIVDEAHHLEAATTSGLSFHLTQSEITRLLKDLGGRANGLLAQVAEQARRHLPPEIGGDVQRAVQQVDERTGECGQMVERLFAVFDAFLSERRDGHPLGPYGQQERIIPATRTLPIWSETELAWDDLRRPLRTVIDALSRMAEALLSLSESGFSAGEPLALSVRTSSRGLEEIFNQLERMIFEPDRRMIYWIECQQPQERLSVHAAPLEVGDLVERHLWHEKDCIIMTSATLTAAGQFDYLRQRLGARDADELAVGSPFDYETSTLLYIPDDIPEPSTGVPYQRAVERGLISLCKATGGRALVLFTSHAQLQRTARAIQDPLAAAGIVVYEQGDGASRPALLESFRTTDQAVLLGTRSFWEGIDVPGEALSVLAIVRLPFDVPNDPIIAARSETFEMPFDEYAIPEAVLRFRQGFGRLIRSRSDRGVVVTLDRRILSKRYGQAFLDSLPQCTMRRGPLHDLPSAAARWLGV